MSKESKAQQLHWRVLLRLFTFTKPHTIHFALTVLNAVKGVALQILTPYLLQAVTDRVVDGHMQAFMQMLLLAGGIFVVDAILTLLGRRAAVRYLNYTIRDLRDRATAHVQRLPIAYLDAFHTGDLTSRLNADVGKIADWLASIPEQAVQPLLFLGGFIYMLTISWKLLLVSCILVPASTLIFNQIVKPMEALSRKQAEEEGKVNAALQDALAGITMIKAFNLWDWLGAKFLTQVKQVERQALQLDLRRVIATPVYLALRYAPQLIVPLYGGTLAYRGEITVGQLLAANMLIWTVFMPIERLLGMLSQVRETVPVVERILELLDQPAEPMDALPFAPVPGAAPVEFVHVGFGYQADDPLLKGLSFRLLPGQTVALTGPSGCGKSTLFKILCGFYHPQQGQVRIHGNDLAKVNLAGARAQVSLVSQQTYLFPTTISENIAYGRSGATEAEIITAAKAANAHDFILEQPQGYQTQVGERGTRLSGGQRQRIALARAILKDAPILLLDEPTSALDTQSEALVQQALDRFMAGRTALIVAHRLSTIKGADHILVLDQGNICEQGTHAVLMQQGGLYRRLVQKQVTNQESGTAHFVLSKKEQHEQQDR
jgi:ABC-type multidrug transport system fused ATPase/permease subunit